MRMMMKVSIPVGPGNSAIKDGSLPKTIGAFAERYKPEGAYFGTENGQRTAFFFFDMKSNADVPSIAEPFFMNLNAQIELQPVMSIADLRSGIEQAMKQG